MSIDTDLGFWKWLVGSITAGIAAMFGYHKYIEGKISKKVDRDLFDVFREEFKKHEIEERELIADIGKQIRDNEQRAQDRYERLMDRLPPR